MDDPVRGLLFRHRPAAISPGLGRAPVSVSRPTKTAAFSLPDAPNLLADDVRGDGRESRIGSRDLEIALRRRLPSTVLAHGHTDDVGQERLDKPTDLGVTGHRHRQGAIERADDEVPAASF